MGKQCPCQNFQHGALDEHKESQGLLALHEHPDNAREPPSNIVASSLPDPRTGVDLFTTIIMDFKKMNARANCKSCIRARTELTFD